MNQLNSSIFYTTRLGKTQPPLLIVTSDGRFIWATDAEERLDLDDYNGIESIRYILIVLWRDYKRSLLLNKQTSAAV